MLKTTLKKILSLFKYLTPKAIFLGLIHFVKNLPRYARLTKSFIGELLSFNLLFIFYFATVILSNILKINFIPQSLRSLILKVIYKITIVVTKFDKSELVSMNRLELFELAIKNMRFKKTRTIITVGGMAVGIGAIVFLVSVGYGLQKLVIDRVARLDEMLQADVSIQPGSNVKLDDRAIASFKEISGVKEVLPIIGVVSKVNYQGSVSDIAVYGVTTSYIQNSAIRTVEGKLFESNSYQGSTGFNFADSNSLLGSLNGSRRTYTEIIDKDGQVAGLSSSREEYQIIKGAKIKDVKFMIYPMTWSKVYETASEDSKFLGYTRKVEGVQFGEEVWGDPYVPARTGRLQAGADGEIYGKWIKSKFFLWEKAKCSYSDIDCEEGTYKKLRDKKDNEDESGIEDPFTFKEGYIAEIDLAVDGVGNDYKIVESQEVPNVLGTSDSAIFEITKESSGIDFQEYTKDINKLEGKNANGEVLALENLAESGNVSDDLALVVSGTEPVSDLEWLDMVLETTTSATEQEVKKMPLSQDALKEAVVNEAFLKVLGLERKDAVGKTFESSFVITSGLLENDKEKVESEFATYKIVGVISGDNTPFFYIPLNDLKGVGIPYFSQVRIIADSQNVLPDIREKIESQGFVTSSVVDTVAQINRLFYTIRLLLALVGAVALAVASLGMFNTLTVSLLERTREVGLMKAMGMSSEEVKRLFLTESMMMGFSGGVGGILLGFLSGKLLSVVFSIMGLMKGVGTVDVSHIPFAFVILIFVLSMIVGIGTGLYPARRATGISALNALRYE